jgi:hypothetical protein
MHSSIHVAMKLLLYKIKFLLLWQLILPRTKFIVLVHERGQCLRQKGETL